MAFRRVCDGARDCPDGEDEDVCPGDGKEEGGRTTLSCPGMFRCRGSVCVHPYGVCDKK